MGTLNNIDIDKTRWTTLILQILMGFAVGLTYQLNVWIEPLCAAYGWKASTLAYMYTFFGISGIPGSIVAGKLIGKYGIKKTVRIAGIVYAASALIAAIPLNVWFFNIGMGIFVCIAMFMVYVASLSNISALFPDKQGMATGLSIAFTSIAAAIWAPIVQKMVEIMNVSVSIAVEGVVAGLMVLILGIVMIEPPKGYMPRGWTPKQEVSVSEKEPGVNRDLPWNVMVRTGGFLCVFGTMFFGYIAIRGFHSSLSYIGQQSYGLSESTGALYFSALSIGMIVGSLLYGVCADKWGPLRVVAISSAIMIIPLIVGLLDRQHTPAVLLFVAIMAGIILAAMETSWPNILIPAYGYKNYGVNFGILYAATAAAAFVGPQVAVANVDTLYTVGIASQVLAVVFTLMAIKLINRYYGVKVIR